METTIKSQTLNSIKKRLIYLYCLNAADILFTLYLISTGYFTEANSLVAKLLKNDFICITVKLFIPAILLYFIYHRLFKATESQLRIANRIILPLLVFYAIIVFSHIFWTFLLIFHYPNWLFQLLISQA